MTRPEDYLLQVQAAAQERKRPFTVAQLDAAQLLALNTARLMDLPPADCELLLNGECVPGPRGAL